MSKLRKVYAVLTLDEDMMPRAVGQNTAVSPHQYLENELARLTRSGIALHSASVEGEAETSVSDKAQKLLNDILNFLDTPPCHSCPNFEADINACGGGICSFLRDAAHAIRDLSSSLRKAESLL